MEKIKKIIYYILMSLVFILGIYLRTKLYMEKGVFEDDECRLVYSMYNMNLWEMLGPLGPWSASPLFMFVSKIIAHFSHYNEYALQFLPYIFSISGIYVFYKITEEYFERGAVKIFANYLFAISAQFLYFTATFKQYSLEVLIGLLCLYYLPKVNILTMSRKQLIIMILGFAIMPLLSVPSLFYIGAFILINLYRHRKSAKELLKRLLLILSPFLIVMVLYYVFNLAPTKAMQTKYFTEFWNKFYSFNILVGVAGHLKYAFSPNKFVLCTFVLLICSSLASIFVQNNNKNKELSRYMLLTYALVLFASAVNIYPYMTRVGLHIIPTMILLITKLIDILRVKNVLFYIVLFLMFIGFGSYFTKDYYNQINDGFASYAPDDLLQIIKKEYSPETDKIAFDEASMFSYYVYAKKHDLYKITKYKRTYIKYRREAVRESVFKSLNELDQSKCYWFYLIKEYKDKQRKEIMEWIERQPNVRLKVVNRDSYLYYVKPPYEKLDP